MKCHQNNASKTFKNARNGLHSAKFLREATFILEFDMDGGHTTAIVLRRELYSFDAQAPEDSWFLLELETA